MEENSDAGMMQYFFKGLFIFGYGFPKREVYGWNGNKGTMMYPVLEAVMVCGYLRGRGFVQQAMKKASYNIVMVENEDVMKTS